MDPRFTLNNINQYIYHSDNHQHFLQNLYAIEASENTKAAIFNSLIFQHGYPSFIPYFPKFLMPIPSPHKLVISTSDSVNDSICNSVENKIDNSHSDAESKQILSPSKQERQLKHHLDNSNHDIVKRKKSQGSISIPNGILSPVWKSRNNDYSTGVIGLHEEIIEFCQYIEPTAAETEMRQAVVDRITEVVTELWPQAKVEIFGSFSTGLYLSTSDIDLVITGEWSSSPLYALENALSKKELAKQITVLDKASVPIIKMTDKLSNVRVDISYNMLNGVRSVNLIKEYISKYSNLRYMVFILKEFLQERGLNEVWTGGISSYSLILMCISFLQVTQRENSKPQANLGVLLIQFFEYYGFNFNYHNVAISIRHHTSLVPKYSVHSNADSAQRASILCIEDPLLQGNDIGRSSYGFLQVRTAFQHARHVLGSSIIPDLMGSLPPAPSILSRILCISGYTLAYRAWIEERLWLEPSPTRPSSQQNNDSSRSSTSDNSDSCFSDSDSSSSVDVENNYQTSDSDVTVKPPVTNSVLSKSYAHVLRQSNGPMKSINKETIINRERSESARTSDNDVIACSSSSSSSASDVEEAPSLLRSSSHGRVKDSNEKHVCQRSNSDSRGDCTTSSSRQNTPDRRAPGRGVTHHQPRGRTFHNSNRFSGDSGRRNVPSS